MFLAVNLNVPLLLNNHFIVEFLLFCTIYLFRMSVCVIAANCIREKERVFPLLHQFLMFSIVNLLMGDSETAEMLSLM